MTFIILLLSLLALTAAAPISITTPSSAAPTGVYTYTGTAITVSGTSIVVPSGPSTAASATSIVVPTAFVFPPVVLAHLDTAHIATSSATCAEYGHVNVALPSASPSVGLSAESAHVSGSGQDGGWCVGAPHCEHGHHSSAAPTSMSAENIHLGAPHPHPHALPILPRQDGPGSVDGNYGVGVPDIHSHDVSAEKTHIGAPSHHGDSVGAEYSCIGAPHCSHGHHSSPLSPSSPPASSSSPSPSAPATSAENTRIGAPSHHEDEHGHGIGAEHGCVGCPDGEHAGAHGHV